jgi:hypothetical protein
MPKKAQIEEITRIRYKRMPKAIPAFQAPPAVCEELQRIGKHQTVESGTTLFERGEQNRGLFVVTSGRFALSSGDDPVRVTRIAEKGSLLGLPATVRDAPYSLTAEAVTDSAVESLAVQSRSTIAGAPLGMHLPKKDCSSNSCRGSG